jgi:hypothetical protein
MIKALNTEKESYVIKLILGFDFIKKYFIDVERSGREINSDFLLKSEDLKTFNSDKFSIKEKNDSSSFTPFISDERNVKITDFSTVGDKSMKCVITIKSLKEKLDNLDIDYEKIFDFYTKIMNKTNFYHIQMINFNSKQIALESRKENNLKRVKEIIIKNKKNIEGLKKFDNKFITLLNKFEKDLDTENLFDNLKEKLKTFDSSPNFCEEFYKKCRIYFSDMKRLNEFIEFNFKNVKNDCTDENMKSNIKQKYKIFKENIKSEKNCRLIENVEYIRDLAKIVEDEYMRETKKLEKIQRVIETYPPSRVSKSIKTQKTQNSEMEENSLKHKLRNFSEEKNNEECIENTIAIEQQDLNFNESIKDEIFQKDEIRSNSEIDNYVNGNVIEVNLDGKNEENILQKSELLSQALETKTDKDFFASDNKFLKDSSTITEERNSDINNSEKKREI